MENKHQKMLYDILKNFEGMSKIDSFSLIHKIEVLLYYTNGPLNLSEVKKIITSEVEIEEIDPFYFNILPNGKFCEFIGSNGIIHIYKEINRFLPDWHIFNTYYFKAKHLPLELQKLSRKNLLKSFEGKPYQQKIKTFLLKHKASKKDLVTNKMLLLNI